MSKLVKLFDLKNNVHAVVAKGYDSDEDKYALSIAFHFEIDECFGVATVTMGWSERERLDEVFNDEMTIEAVQAMADDHLTMFFDNN